LAQFAELGLALGEAVGAGGLLDHVELEAARLAPRGGLAERREPRLRAGDRVQAAEQNREGLHRSPPSASRWWTRRVRAGRGRDRGPGAASAAARAPSPPAPGQPPRRSASGPRRSCSPAPPRPAAPRS